MDKLYFAVFGGYQIKTTVEMLGRLSGAGVYYTIAEPCDGGITAYITLFGLTRAESVAAVHGSDLTVVKATGIPFIVSRYRKRIGIYVGMALACLMLFASQLFVFGVSVTGNKNLSDGQIKRVLEHCGIYVGAFIPDIRVYTAETNAVLLEEDLSSVAINIKGNHIEVDVIERVHAPQVQSKDGVSDLAASDSGIVVDVQAKNGYPLVKVGDAVTKGQVLVTGDVTTKNGTHYYCRAIGSVFAEVKKSFTVKVPTVLTKRCFTGQKRTQTQYTLLGYPILTLGEAAKYDFCECESSQTELKLFGMSTTLFKTTNTYSEYVYQSYAIDASTAKARCLAALKQYLESISDRVKDYDYLIRYDAKSDAYILDAHITLIKDIAYEIVPSLSPSASESIDRA